VKEFVVTARLVRGTNQWSLLERQGDRRLSMEPLAKK